MPGKLPDPPLNLISLLSRFFTCRPFHRHSNSWNFWFFLGANIRVGSHEKGALKYEILHVQINDPNLQPRMQPRPADDALFLQGLLEGIATIEARMYALLADMGASPLRQVHNRIMS